MGDFNGDDRGCVRSIAFHPKETLFASGGESGRGDIYEIWERSINHFASFELAEDVSAIAFNTKGPAAILSAGPTSLTVNVICSVFIRSVYDRASARFCLRICLR